MGTAISCEIALGGICIMQDNFFADFPSENHCDNKKESRPHCLAIQEENGIVWMVPISHNVGKYKRIVQRNEENHELCIFCHIGKFMGRESAFLTGNVFPTTGDYISRPFTVGGVAYIVQDRQLMLQIRKRVSKYLALVRQGRLQPAVDILRIENVLLNRIKNHEYMI